MLNLSQIPLLNIVLTFVSSATMRLCSIIVTTILVKGVGQAEFGHYMYIITTALMLSSLSAMSTEQAYTRFVSQHKETKQSFPHYLSNLLLLFIGFSSLFFIYSIWMVPNKYIIENWQLIAIVAFLEIVNSAFTAMLSGKESFNKVLQARVIFSIVLCSIVTISIHFNQYLSVLPYIIAVFASNIYLLKTTDISVQIKTFISIKKSEFISFYQTYIKISFPVFLAGIMVTPVQWFLSNQIALHNGFGELGLFNVSMQFRMVILMVTNSVATALLPRLANTYQSSAFSQLTKTGYVLSAALCIISFGAVVLLMPYVFNFYNIETTETILLTSYLLLATTLPLCLYNLYTQVLIAKGQTKTLLLFNAFWGVLVLILYFTVDVINNYSVATIMCISYFALIAFVFIFNWFSTRNRSLVEVTNG